MSDQTSPELTTRDVLTQVARRIELLETDARKMDSKIDARSDTHDNKIDALAERIDLRFRHLTTTVVAVAALFVAIAGAFAAYLTVLRDSV